MAKTVWQKFAGLIATKEIQLRKNADLTIVNSSGTKSTIIDAGTGNVTVPGTLTQTGAVTHSALVTFQTATSGTLHGAGASGANHALGTTADNAMEYYLNATHTTGDMRGMYLRLYFSGAGGSGEALRAFGTVNNVTAATGGTVNGAHISLSVNGASGAVSGAGNALRATYGIGAGATPGGTCSVIQVDTDFNATATTPTNFAFLRFTNTGASTDVPKALFRMPNIAAASADVILAAHTTDAMTHSVRFVTEDGTEYHIMCTTTTTNRTEA